MSRSRHWTNGARAACRAALLVPVLAAGCMTERLPPVVEHPSLPRQAIFPATLIDHDEYGRPRIGKKLLLRPGSTGDRFTVVHEINGRPSRTYDIVIMEKEKADLTRPFAVIYEWTGRGFEGGLAIAEGIAPSGTISSGAQAAAYLAVKTAPVVVTTITGFVVGVLASVPAAAAELGRVIVDNRELLLGYTDYLYDERGRIRFMKLYPPDGRVEPLVRTEFFYEGSSSAPSRTEVISMPDGKVRTVRCGEGCPKDATTAPEPPAP